MIMMTFIQPSRCIYSGVARGLIRQGKTADVAGANQLYEGRPIPNHTLNIHP